MAGLRIVRAVTGKSIIIALSLPSGLGAPPRFPSSKTFTVATALPTHDRTFWQRFSNSPILLKISNILRGLGLRQLNSGRGKILFQYDNVSQLADAVAGAATRLPTTLEELLDAATNYTYGPLQEEIAQLLHRFGDEIWGANSERIWLLNASEGSAEYQKDLMFENAADQVVLMYYLRLWILVKAFNRMRTKAQPHTKMPSQAGTSGQAKWDTSGQLSKLPLPLQHSSTHMRRDAFAAEASLATSLSVNSSLYTAPKQHIDLHAHNNLQVHTAPQTPRLQKDVGLIECTSDAAPKQQLRTDTNISRSNASRDVFAPRLIGKPEDTKSKSVLLHERYRNEDVDGDDAIAWAHLGERRSKRLGKKKLTGHMKTPIFNQGAQKPRAKRRPRRKYLSEEVVRVNSDASEGENTLTLISHLKAFKVPGIWTREPAPHAKQYHDISKRHSTINSELNSISLTTGSGASTKSTFERQGSRACKSCQRRHQKCDRAYPTCKRCEEFGFTCEYIEIIEVATTIGSPLTSISISPSIQDTSNEHGPNVKPATEPTTPMTTSKLPLDKYWDKDEWRSFYLEGNEREIVLATIRSLGLRAVTRYTTQLGFDIENFLSLGEDIIEIAWRLSSKFSAAKLIQCAEDRTYLDAAIDTLFETHSSIWSLDADRTKLLVPGVDQNYPKDLVYEESEDQRLLWTHLHRWIFISAFGYCKQIDGLDGFVSKTTDKSNTGPISGDTTFADSGFEKHKRKDMVEDFGQYSVKESRQRDGSDVLLTAYSDLAPEKSLGRGQKRIESSIERIEQEDILRPLKQRRTDQDRTRSEGHSLGTLFTSYLENYNDTEFDELAALKNLAHELSVLRYHATSFHIKQTIEAATAFFTVSFPAWLLYRQEIVDTKRKHAAMHASRESSQLHRHLAVLERSRLATQLRQAREKFVNAGHDGLRPEQVIFQAMTLLTDEQGRSQAVQNIKNGFQGMENELMTLSDQLMKDGGAKWVMGDYPPVSSLDLSSH